MSLPTSRESLKQWCLRELGAPVIEINVDDQQLEDRLDEAIQYFQNYHIDGVEETCLKHQVTASELVFTDDPTVEFANNETITGQTSGAIAAIYDSPTTDSVRFVLDHNSPNFQVGEVVEGGTGGGTATIQTITMGDIDNGYIEVSDAVIAVRDVITTQSNPLNMWDIRYQFALQRMSDIKSMDLVTYDMAQTHFQFLNEIFNPRLSINFNRYENKLYLQQDFWRNKITPGAYLVVQAYRVLDPATVPQIYGDMWLRKWTTMLFKRQWAANLSKFENIELPGGVKLNVAQLKAEAEKEKEELEKRLKSEFMEPCDFFVG